MHGDRGSAVKRPAARWATGALLIAPAAFLLGACGGGAPAASGSGTASLSRSCQSVAAVLSDGPGPKEDPVGYAEAQVKPLAHVRTSDPPLRRAIGALDRAYRNVEATDGSAVAAKAERAASGRVDHLCPGAAP